MADVLDYMVANRHKLVAYAELICNRRGYGDDIYQEAFIRLAFSILPDRAAKGLAPVMYPRAFIGQVMRWQWYTMTRRLRHSPVAEAQLDHALPEYDKSDEGAGEEAVTATMDLRKIEAVTGKHFAVLHMHAQGFVYREIATMTGLHERQACRYRERAINQLRAAGMIQ